MASRLKTARDIDCSCHCGAIKYTFRLTEEEGRALKSNRCNCTLCTKTGTTNYHINDPATNFTLQKPKAKDEVASYAVGKKCVKRYFCTTCGVHCWMEGSYPIGDGKTFPVFTVNLGTVDQPQEGIDLSTVKLGYFDMLNDNMKNGPRDTPFSYGLP